MGIMGVLFNPNGRIRANQFWQGVIVLIALQIFIQLGWGYVSSWFILAFFFLVFPYLCVYGKRLHDSGKTAWLFLAFLIGALVLSQVIGMFTAGFSNVDQAEFQEKMTILTEEENIGGLFALMQEAVRADMLLSFVTIIANNVIVGFFCARLWSDPYPNAYGDPVGGYVADEDEDDFLT